MKIQDDDILWKLYLRYHKGSEGKIPEPKSLCPYFWQAMGGLFLRVFIDLPVYLIIPAMVVIATGGIFLMVYTPEEYVPNWTMYPFCGALVLLTMFIPILCLVRYGMWVERQTGWTYRIAFGVPMTFVMC